MPRLDDDCVTFLFQNPYVSRCLHTFLRLRRGIGPLYSWFIRSDSHLLMLGFFHTADRAMARFNQLLGKCLSWCIGLMALVVFGIVVTRALMNVGSVAVQETVTYMHAAVFLLCLAYTAQMDGHVRVDVFYREMPDLAKHWVNACGAILFLIPFSVFLVLISWRFVLNSWSVLEGSSNPGGLPAVFILKSMIPLAGILLGIRGFSEALRELVRILYIHPKSE